MKTGRIFSIIYAFVLVAFSAYVLLDSFVIPRSYKVVTQNESSLSQEDETNEESGTTENIEKSETSSQTSADESEETSENSSKTEVSETGAVSGAEKEVTENSYSDENISIKISEYRQNDTAIYVADVTLSSPEYLKTAFAQGIYGKNVTEKTSVIAEECSAILAINGDYYGSQNRGYVIRNGVIYRDTAERDREDLVIYSDGSFGIINESDITADELLSNGAQQVLSFGPALIEDGEISVTERDEVGKAKASNPRTAIGIIDSCHYVFVVSDGRTSASSGLSLLELAEFMQSLGISTAYNLDGGGSSTMVFNGTVINNPTTNGKIKERSVSDIVYIG